MISPDVAAAVAQLERRGVLAPEQAHLFRRIATGELVSLAPALNALLYLGVLALTTGVGLLFRDEIANLGPLTIAFLVGLGSVLCLTWAARRSPPFSAFAVISPHFAFDSVLALGALLAAADLAFIESRFSNLGEQWTLHLLVVSVFYGALAFRFDSRSLWALSLTTFAAWRGVASTSVERVIFGFFNDTDAIRLNALGCGVAFIFLGGMLARRGVKAHFEPTAVHLGWLLVLQAVAWGIDSGPSAALHRLALFVIGSALAGWAFRGGRFALFVFGVLAAYFSFIVSLADIVENGIVGLFLTAVSAISLVLGLAAMHRRFPREPEE